MPALLIEPDPVEGWLARVANTEVVYQFEPHADMGAGAVHELAEMMHARGGDFANLFVWPDGAPEDAAELVTQQLFATTDQIWLAGRAVYGTIGANEFLIDVLEEAGEILLGFLA